MVQKFPYQKSFNSLANSNTKCFSTYQNNKNKSSHLKYLKDTSLFNGILYMYNYIAYLIESIELTNTFKHLLRYKAINTCSIIGNVEFFPLAKDKKYLRLESFTKILALLTLLSLVLPTEGSSCIANCSCTSVPTGKISPEKWPAFMPSASPTLLSYFLNIQNKFAKEKTKSNVAKLPEVILETISPQPSPDKIKSDSIEGELDSTSELFSKRKRDIQVHDRQKNSDVNINENIIEMEDTVFSSAPNKVNDHVDKEAIEMAGDYSSYLQALKNDPKFRQLYMKLRQRGRNSTFNGKTKDRGTHKTNSVPQIIQEQIPDFHSGYGSVSNTDNIKEEIQWLSNETSNKENIRVSENNAHASNEEDRIAVVCDKNSFFDVPNSDDVDQQFNFLDVLSLDLSFNNITNLSATALEEYSQLRYLSLRHNFLLNIDEKSFSRQLDLDTLDLSENFLVSIPSAVIHCKSLRILLLAENQISFIEANKLFGLVDLQWVDLKNNPILNVDNNAFSGLPSLTKLILKEFKELSVFPNLSSSRELEVMRIDRAALEEVPLDLCVRHPKLLSLNLHLNLLKKLPILDHCQQLKLLDVSNNEIQVLDPKAFQDTPNLQDLLLQFNFIQTIPSDAFEGLHHLQVLNLEHNHISHVDPDAFLPLHNIEDLNLGNNIFPTFPSEGLEHVLYLKVHNNRHLVQFPGPESFPAVRSLVLSYAYHCCPFLGLIGEDNLFHPLNKKPNKKEEEILIHEDVIFNIDELQKHDPKMWNQTYPFWPYNPHTGTNFTALWVNLAGRFPAATSTTSPPPNRRTSPYGYEIDSQLKGYISQNAELSAIYDPYWTTTPKPNPPQSTDSTATPKETERQNLHEIQCIPQPGPFMPCRDLFDWWTLRCGVWLVFLLALMGNGVVVVVLIAAYAKMDVPRFLVTNLALADFFMGVYLGFLAVVDASTLGQFRVHAIPWQMSASCQMAGFFGVFSSELSVYTLTVITLERNYAIIHAMNLNKRLSLKHAAYIMTVGWVFALTMAILPLTGVSDYRKFAVCLPFETDGAGLGYVVFLMVINGVAFLILMGCYLKIYCAIRGSQAWNSNDSRIAKRMALLVFTDFICWAPIAFFSLSAAYGLQLISLEEAKVFTVFVLPLNSCCNPFLYALLTKQFKKDCVMLCKQIEESRVTRGIGRCRHSSNFSNRQTPANTNSALDSKSRETCSCGATEKRLSKPYRLFNYICCRNKKIAKGTYSKGHRRQLSPKKELEENKNLGNWSWKNGWKSTQKPSPLRLLDLRRPASLDLTRKSSQESSLSSSRHDSSSASTATWRVSRSSMSSDASKVDATSRSGSSQKDEFKPGNRHSFRGVKPRLQRQRAIEKDINSGSSRLNCPVHNREELSCVYEQASIEEAAEIKLNPSPRFCHRRSLSDGLLFCTLTATQPYADIKPNPASLLVRSPTVHPTNVAREEVAHISSPLRDSSVTEDSSTSKRGLLETHFPVKDQEEESAEKEMSPLLSTHEQIHK